MSKPDIGKVNPRLADIALTHVNYVRQSAYSEYIKLCYRQTGSLACGCDNKDLQAYFNGLQKWRIL